MLAEILTELQGIKITVDFALRSVTNQTTFAPGTPEKDKEAAQIYLKRKLTEDAKVLHFRLQNLELLISKL